MSYPINYPTPQGANIQIFNCNETGGVAQRWIKPQGASFVWFTLIGAGAGGDGTTGGGSGAVTNFMGPAFLMPDDLVVNVGKGGQSSSGGTTNITYVEKTGGGYTLLNANGGQLGGTGGTASASNYFSCMGFFQSVAGQAGSVGGGSASSTTFLSGGAVSTTTANYGYDTSRNGYFNLSPIIVGVGGAGSGAVTGNGGTGCGGGYLSGKGGDGLVVIITW